jgi:glycosyltransferase involved in cell wall biosynthesis
MNKPSIGYLVSHPIQYQAPLFRQLAASERVEFTAIFGCDFGLRSKFDPQFGREVDFGIDLLEGYRSVFLPQAPTSPRIDRFRGLRTPSVSSVFDAVKVDVLVLHGWATMMMWQAAFGAAMRAVPYLMRAETPVYRDVARRRSASGRLRDVVVRRLLRNASGALTLGQANERFYRELGVPEETMFRMPYFVDNDSVAECARRGRADREALRDRLGVPRTATLIVSVGKLMPRKRPLDLVRALAMLAGDVHLVWIGSGEMEGAVRAEAESLGVEDRVHVLGFQPAPDTWTVLGGCDVFALASEREPWGLVINEAVVAGLPAVVSDQCGAAEDLIASGRTGDIVPTGDIARWVATLQDWMDRLARGDVGDVGERNRRAALHSVDRAATALEDAALATYGRCES